MFTLKDSIKNHGKLDNRNINVVKFIVTSEHFSKAFQAQKEAFHFVSPFIMTTELVKAFQSMSFVDKMEIMNTVLEKAKMKGK